MYISSSAVKHVTVAAPRARLANTLLRSVELALFCFACTVVQAHADSLFGAIDPFNVGKKVSPGP